MIVLNYRWRVVFVSCCMKASSPFHCVMERRHDMTYILGEGGRSKVVVATLDWSQLVDLSGMGGYI